MILQGHQKAFIGHLAPPFSGTAVMDSDFKTVSLSDYKDKYLVLFFYPSDFSFICPTEIISFSNRYEDFQANKCELLAASTDSYFTHFAWLSLPRKAGGLGEIKFPILADPSLQISKDYGMLFEDEGVAYRGLFIIDGKGIIRHVTINDFPVGRSVDETLRLVQALQYTDVHGQVCSLLIYFFFFMGKFALY
ncbi:unnamed protein product [Gongylonema pulchrum]|uniref:thioredoxin-dependent peroxiredoxin n=1 Tax=Gongylonema pulchrum TaxID=637853 RepID=A0A183CYI5_9BILA|nr:unnamed protein product [Gongylonema pulchrum]